MAQIRFEGGGLIPENSITGISIVDKSIIAQDIADGAIGMEHLTEEVKGVQGLGLVGTKAVDEASIADKKILAYDSGSDKVEYIDNIDGGTFV